MQRYKVVVQRPRWEFATVYVDATDEGDAIYQACAEANDDQTGDDLCWEGSSVPGDAIAEIADVEEYEA